MADKQVKQPKGDPDKQYDVMISVIHDNRKGISRPVEKPTRISFATEEEALAFANKLKEL
jgi:hypothetical protein